METSLYRFRVVAGPESGRQFTVGQDGALIGRAENCDVIVIDPSLSRHHCRLFWRDGLLWVADLKSSNTTEVDGVLIQEAPLWKDRRIYIGDTVIWVESDTGQHPPLQPAQPKPDIPIVSIALGTVAAILLVIYLINFVRRPDLIEHGKTVPPLTATQSPQETTWVAEAMNNNQTDVVISNHQAATDTNSFRSQGAGLDETTTISDEDTLAINWFE